MVTNKNRFTSEKKSSDVSRDLKKSAGRVAEKAADTVRAGVNKIQSSISKDKPSSSASSSSSSSKRDMGSRK